MGSLNQDELGSYLGKKSPGDPKSFDRNSIGTGIQGPSLGQHCMTWFLLLNSRGPGCPYSQGFPGIRKIALSGGSIRGRG